MRGQRERQQSMFVAFNIEERVPDDHPLREIKRRCDRILAAMSRDFDRCYGTTGRVGIPPESMLKALLLRALFGIPSERRLCEACEFNVLYRWFLDWPLERPMWTPEVFSMNRERFEGRALVTKFFERVVAEGLVVDAGYGAGEFLREVESRGITPHAAMPRGKIKGDSEAHRARRWMRRCTRTKAYRVSQRLRRFIEPVIGWCKHVSGLARTRFIGHERIQDDAMMTAAAWNLMRMTKLSGRT